MQGEALFQRNRERAIEEDIKSSVGLRTTVHVCILLRTNISAHKEISGPHGASHLWKKDGKFKVNLDHLVSLRPAKPTVQNLASIQGGRVFLRWQEPSYMA